MNANNTNHNHKFVDPVDYGFEDVLVTEYLCCDTQHCEMRKPIQYEVDFDNFEINGESVDNSTAESVWDDICNAYEIPIVIRKEKIISNGIEITTQDGNTITILRSNGEMSTVTVELDDSEVTFEVSLYRELSETKPSF